MKKPRAPKPPRGYRIVTRGKVHMGDIGSLGGNIWWPIDLTDERDATGRFHLARRLPRRSRRESK